MPDGAPSQALAEPSDELDFGQKAVFGFSWVLVVAIGLMPLLEASRHREPSISTPAAIAFFAATASALVIRRSYTWVGLVLHVFSQIMIWLSLFVMSLALVLYAF